MSEQSTAVANRAPNSFELELAEKESQIVSALPAHIPADRFKRAFMASVNKNPKLMKAERRSFFIALSQAAQDGLLPDGREAALVIFNAKDKDDQGRDVWVDKVQYMPMIAGILKRLRNTDELASMSAHVVFEKDDFSYELGDSEHITHKPKLGDRGKPVAVYAIAHLTNKEVVREIMSVQQVERVRSVSRAKDKGPWVDWWDEMARKTVMKRLAKRLPMSSDLDELLQRDNETYFPTTDSDAPDENRLPTAAERVAALTAPAETPVDTAIPDNLRRKAEPEPAAPPSASGSAGPKVESPDPRPGAQPPQTEPPRDGFGLPPVEADERDASAGGGDPLATSGADLSDFDGVVIEPSEPRQIDRPKNITIPAWADRMVAIIQACESSDDGELWINANKAAMDYLFKKDRTTYTRIANAWNNAPAGKVE